MTISEDALNAGLAAGRRAYRHLYQNTHDPRVVRMVDNAVEDALESAAPFMGQGADPQTCQLIRDLTDPNDCDFDHKGGCQAHGYLSLKPGELCPQQEAKTWLQGQAGFDLSADQ